MTQRAILLILAVAAVASARTATPKFYPDDPLWVDADTIDTPVRPAEVELSDLFDRFGHIIATPGTSESVEALNVNTLDEVPDSSWFTNRHGRDAMSIEALARGPDSSDGPDLSAPWRIFRSKSQGLTPGFQIIDGRGDRYVIKFDPIRSPELSSGAEIIATKLFYALGYHTPENYIVLFDPARLEIVDGTTIEDESGAERPLTRERLMKALRRVPRLPDGRIRSTASKYLPGIPIGPFRYHGTRSDDPNDVIPHEHRRELRGLRVFAAWLNHDDTRSHNTQDAWVEESGRHYVRHYLLDFGSTLGSGSVEAQLPWLGYHYWLDPDLVKRNLRTFGFSTPAYHKIRFREFPSIGRIEADAFEPDTWRNDYPNPAFVRMTDRDAFWAAKILIRFTRDELRAIVATARYSDPEAEAYLLDVLVARQRKTAGYYITRVNPLDRFRVSPDGLSFDNLAETYGFVEPGTAYVGSWAAFDNATGASVPLTDERRLEQRTLPFPAAPLSQDGQPFLVADIRSLHDAYPGWQQPIRVYLRAGSGGYEVVGIDRESPAVPRDAS